MLVRETEYEFNIQYFFTYTKTVYTILIEDTIISRRDGFEDVGVLNAISYMEMVLLRVYKLGQMVLPGLKRISAHARYFVRKD